MSERIASGYGDVTGPQRYVLGFAFTWEDLIAAARDRARLSGKRQKIARHDETWLITPTPPTQEAAMTAAMTTKEANR